MSTAGEKRTNLRDENGTLRPGGSALKRSVPFAFRRDRVVADSSELTSMCCQIGVLTHAVGIAADIGNVAVVQDSIDLGGRHHFVSQDLTPFLEALVGGQHGGGVFVAAAHHLVEQRRPVLAHRRVARGGIRRSGLSTPSSPRASTPTRV
jgi:hypothetical protein